MFIWCLTWLQVLPPVYKLVMEPAGLSPGGSQPSWSMLLWMVIGIVNIFPSLCLSLVVKTTLTFPSETYSARVKDQWYLKSHVAQLYVVDSFYYIHFEKDGIDRNWELAWINFLMFKAHHQGQRSKDSINTNWELAEPISNINVTALWSKDNES